MQGTYFHPQVRRLVVWYSDGRAYLPDIEWLRAMAGDPAALAPEELERLGCQYGVNRLKWVVKRGQLCAL